MFIQREAEPGYGYGHATSYYHRSPQGLHGYHYYGKREAQPGYYGGYHGAVSHQYVSRPFSHYTIHQSHY